MKKIMSMHNILDNINNSRNDWAKKYLDEEISKTEDDKNFINLYMECTVSE